MLQTFCDLGLSASKAKTDALLEHMRPVVTVRSDSVARQLILHLASLGVVARFAEGDDYKPEERLDEALSQVASLVPSASLANCRAFAAHGEWELALSHCLASLGSSEAEVPSEVEGLLSELVVEFGLVASGAGQNGA